VSAGGGRGSRVKQERKEKGGEEKRSKNEEWLLPCATFFWMIRNRVCLCEVNGIPKNKRKKP
jgi:hypothetical protein